MKSKFIKFFFGFALFSTLLFVPSIQTLVLKNAISIFTPYKLVKVENLKLNIFPLKIQSNEVQICEKKTNNNISLSNIEIKFQNFKWNFVVNEIHYTTSANQEFVDMTGFTPEVLAKFLQQSFVSLKNISSIQIQKFLFGNQTIKVLLEQ